MTTFIKSKIIYLILLLAGFSLSSLTGCMYGLNVYDANHTKNIIPGIEKANAVDATFVSILATGRGLAPENGSEQKKKLLADRAAVVDAYRNLSERITGFILAGYTNQGLNEISIDRIRVESNTYIRGAQVLEVVYFEGVSTATVKVLVPANKKFMIVPNQ